MKELLAKMEQKGFYFPSARSDETGIVYDIKNALGYPSILNSIVDEFNTLLPKHLDGVVATSPEGIILAATLASKYGYELTTIKNRANGWANRIIGAMPSRDSSLAYIDTVFNAKTNISAVQNFVEMYMNSNLDNMYVLQK